VARQLWTASYPAGVPGEIDPGRYASIIELCDESLQRHAARVAFRQRDRAISYAETLRRARCFAAWLQARGLSPGERVAVMLPNCLEHPVAVLGTLLAGGVVVNVNPFFTPRELGHHLVDSQARAIVVADAARATLEQVAERGTLQHSIDESELPAVLQPGAEADFAPVAHAPDDVAFLQYTGGTTGVSKAAVLLHRNVAAAVLQYRAWLSPSLSGEPPVVVTVLPLYHVYAQTVNCLCMLQFGAENLLVENPRDLDALVGELGRRRFSVLSGVNTLFASLLDHPGFASLDFSALRVVLGGGMATRCAVAERWRRTTGVEITETYGLTECAPAVTANPLGRRFDGSIGLPLPSTVVAVRDDDNREAAPGEPGEICVRGPQVMPGYWNRPDETLAVIDAEGFLHTGDVGRIDERGFVWLLERRKDMILVSGFNVYPAEIEQVVATLPGVVEAAAVGVADPHSGEVPKVFVVRRDAGLSETDVLEHCRKSLAAYKCPRHVEFVDGLPKSPVGKILRRALRDG
jgi:long-chain acyl-CoA synthetase